MKYVETIVDEAGIEINVGYSAVYCAGSWEEGHGLHKIGEGYEIEITSVEVVICGRGIDILSQLDKRQIEKIESVLESHKN